MNPGNGALLTERLNAMAHMPAQPKQPVLHKQLKQTEFSASGLPSFGARTFSSRTQTRRRPYFATGAVMDRIYGRQSNLIYNVLYPENSAAGACRPSTIRLDSRRFRTAACKDTLLYRTKSERMRLCEEMEKFRVTLAEAVALPCCRRIRSPRRTP